MDEKPETGIAGDEAQQRTLQFVVQAAQELHQGIKSFAHLFPDGRFTWIMDHSEIGSKTWEVLEWLSELRIDKY